jgi:endoglucanase
MHPASRFRAALRARRLPAFAAAALLLAACQDSPMGPDSPPQDGRKPGGTTPVSPLAGAVLYVDPASSARRQADAWRITRPADAAALDKVASHAQGQWFGGWNADVRADADRATSAAVAAGAVPVFVAYNIPQRDCGGLSGGGGATPDAYRAWVAALADGIGARRAVVIVEPDALAMMDCLSAADQQVRVELLRHAVGVLRAKGKISVYLDAGHSRWHSAATMADRLKRADVASAAGFALNVSNFQTTASNLTYGEELSRAAGGKRFVIDTSRNGVGPTPDSQWCNPDGRALGAAPTTSTGHALADAFLWVKRPGESDGACNGGPAAGQWWAEYALGLARRASW